MYRTPPTEPTQTFVHRPGPAVVIYIAMAFVALTVVPAFFLAPARSLGGGGVFGGATFLGFEVLLFAIARRHVLLTVDARRTKLELRDVRWPLSPRQRVVPVPSIRDVTVQKAPRSPAVRLALVLESGEHVPLTQSYFGGGAHTDRDLAAIRKLCGLS